MADHVPCVGRAAPRVDAQLARQPTVNRYGRQKLLELLIAQRLGHELMDVGQPVMEVTLLQKDVLQLAGLTSVLDHPLHQLGNLRRCTGDVLDLARSDRVDKLMQ